MSKTIDVHELKRIMENDPTVQIVDVRSQDEFESGHVPRAVNIPLEQLEARLDDLGGRVAIFCRTGNRASMACDLLSAHHDNVMIVDGGLVAWSEAGLPVTPSLKRARWSLERQVRLGAGLMVLAGTLLSLTVNSAWIYLAVFVGAGLTFAGLTDLCLMAGMLAKLPWNRPKSTNPKPSVQS